MNRRLLLAAALLAALPLKAMAQSLPPALASTASSSTPNETNPFASGGGMPNITGSGGNSSGVSAPIVTTPQNQPSNSPTAGLYGSGATTSIAAHDTPANNSTASTPLTSQGATHHDHNAAASPAAPGNDAAAAIAAHKAEKNDAPPTYDAHGEPYSSRYYLSQNSDFSVSLEGRPGLPSEDFRLHIAARNPMTSCAKYGAIPNTVTFADGEMTVALKDYSIDYRNAGANPEYGCHLRAATPSADIDLTRQELEEQQVKTIMVTIDRHRDVFKVTLSPHSLRLELVPGATEPRLHPRMEARTPLVYWFYPKGTVLLYVAGAHPGQDVHGQMDTVARDHDLVPLTDQWPEFVAPVDTPGFAYYVDKNDKLLKGDKPEDTAQIGQITVTRTLYGLNGDETEEKQLPVFVRAPQENE